MVYTLSASEAVFDNAAFCARAVLAAERLRGRTGMVEVGDFIRDIRQRRTT